MKAAIQQPTGTVQCAKCGGDKPAKPQTGIPPTVAALTASILNAVAPDPWTEPLKARSAEMKLSPVPVIAAEHSVEQFGQREYEATLADYVRNPPDAYRASLVARATETVAAHTYQPFGTPPDGYKGALRARQEARR